jgi:maltose alpha-D-glucosyltransferase/alpha-amylase
VEFLYPENRKVLTFMRTFGDERILVVVNLSRHAQYVELDLSQFREMVPVELFGGTEFPKIGELPYFLTLSPHGFYWFSLEPSRDEVSAAGSWHVPTIEVSESWQGVFAGPAMEQLEAALPAYLPTRRWFGGKGRRISGAHVVETIPVPGEDDRELAVLTMVQVDYAEGDPERYSLLLSPRHIERGAEIHELSALARLTSPREEWVLFDGVYDRDVAVAMLDTIVRRRRLSGDEGRLSGIPGGSLRRIVREGEADGALEPQVVQAEQSNTSIVYGDRLILKLFRRVDEGLNPDLEMGAFLTDRAGFEHIPPATGAIEYRGASGRPSTVGILQGYVPNEGDAWKFTQDALHDFVEQAVARADDTPQLPDRSGAIDLMALRPPELAFETIGPYLESARLLGRRTAELHVALASDAEDPDFAPEPFTPFKRRSAYQSMRTLVRQVFRGLRGSLRHTPGVSEIVDREDEVLVRMERLLHGRIDATLIRTHGDYHLGQVLWTGKDFVIIDFEGEPSRPVSQRRLKRTAIRDVAGMLRSFHYAAQSMLYGPSGGLRAEEPERLEPWLRFWDAWVQAAFLGSYLETAGEASFVPSNREELEILLDASLLEKAVYELDYEVNNRPDWVGIPIQGITRLLGPPPAGAAD